MDKSQRAHIYAECKKRNHGMSQFRTPDPIFGKRRYDRHEMDAFPDDYWRDYYAILQSKGLRLMGKKTQVTTLPSNHFIRDRASHTNEVVAIALQIARMLGLNESLVLAIALGHDIGHVPFGHQGENWLGRRMGKPEFCHEVMGVVLAQFIERKCKGLNLCWETLIGMMCHSGHMAKKFRHLMSPEALVVAIADKIAYLFADYNDFARLGFRNAELDAAAAWFGDNQRQRNSVVISALCIESVDNGFVDLKTSEVAERFWQFRTLMYQHYPKVTEQELDFLDKIWSFIESMKCDVDPALAIALMTDHDVLRLADVRVLNHGHIMSTALGERMPYIQGRSIDMCNPDIDWGIPAAASA